MTYLRFVACSLAIGLCIPMLAHATPDLTVTGNVPSGGCTPSLQGNADVDFGHISTSTLNAAAPTVLQKRSVTLQVSCATPSSPILRLVDERSDSVVHLMVPGMELHPLSMMGLGAAAGVGIGMYVVMMVDNQADGERSHLVARRDGFGWGMPVFQHPLSSAYQVGYQTSQLLDRPGQYRVMTSTLEVMPVIRPRNELDGSGDIRMDGAATLEIMQL